MEIAAQSEISLYSSFFLKSLALECSVTVDYCVIIEIASIELRMGATALGPQ